MGFFSAFMDMMSGGAQRLGSSIQSASDRMKFKEPTRLDRFLAGPGQTVDTSPEGRKAAFESGKAANEKAMADLADMVDPGGERTDPNTGRSVRETRGYEQKSGSTAAPKTMITSSSKPTPAAATKTEPTPPAAPKTVAEDATSSGEIEDEVDANKGKGKKSTILTSAQGLLSEAPTRGKRKLKGLIA